MMPSRFQSIAVTVTIVAAAIRIAAVITSVESPPDLMPLRDTVRAALRSGDLNLDKTDPRVEAIAWERFDGDALVVLLPGPDGQPGVAGIDDNGNAVVDDRTELGATGSDDECVVRPIGMLDRQRNPIRLILQRGAFLAVDSAQIAPSDRVRAIVTGHVGVEGDSGNDRWSFLVSMP